MERQWNPQHEAALEALATLKLAEAETKVGSLSSSDKALLAKQKQTVNSILSMFLIYLYAFEEILTDGPLAKVVSSETVAWVKGAPNDSATRVAGMTAASLCAAIEDMIEDLAGPKITLATIARLRRARSLPADDGEARQRLLRSIRPSVKADGAEWAQALKDIFGMTMAREVEETLIAMIAFRNKYIHDPNAALSHVVSGEQLKSWALASLVLSHILVFG